MSLRPPVRAVALGASLLLGAFGTLGCKGEAPEADKGKPLPVIEEKWELMKKAPGPDKPPPRQGRWAKEPEQRLPFSTPSSEPKKGTPLTVGMSREQVLDVLGRCAARVAYIPQGPSRRGIEIFQPANPGCVELFGARNFQVIHGTLAEIGPTMMEATPPPPVLTGK